MYLKILNQPPTQRSCERPWPAFTPNKQSGPSTRRGTHKIKTTIALLKTIGVPRIILKDPSSPVTTEVHKGIQPTAILRNIIPQTHHNGCKIWLSQWTLAVQGPSTEEGEEEETSEGVGANTIINPPIVFRATLQTQETPRMHVFNVDK